MQNKQNFKRRLYFIMMFACTTILLFTGISYSILDYYAYGSYYDEQGILVKHFLSFGLISIAFSVPILFVTHCLVKYLVRYIYDPINELISCASQVKQTKDFTITAKKFCEDELGELSDTFNGLIQEIKRLEDAHERSLQQSQQSACHYLSLFEQAEKVNRELEREAQDRLKAENRLEVVRLHLNDIINFMPSALICVNEEGIITEWNQAAAELFRKPSANTIGYDIKEVLPKVPILHELIDDTLQSRETKHLEKIRTFHKQQEFFHDILAYPLMSDGTPCVVLRIDNVSTQVRMQDMMVQTEKMMSVGGLAAGMAHEINNPLGAIMQSAQNIIRRIDANTPANRKVAQEVGLDWQAFNQYLEQRKITKFLESILDGGQRAATIVANMLQFSRKSDHKLIMSDMATLSDRVISLAANDYDLKKDYDFRKIKIIREYQENLPKVPCIASEVEQVMLNLFRNAAQAMNEAKTPNQHLIIRLFTKDAKMYIEVEDNGPGMPMEVQKKIFEPFYTTKEVGVGTGLGLSVSYFIIKDKHSGELTVRSEVGESTCFTIEIPLEVYQEDGLDKTG